jgi:hypothetical protein
MQITKVRVDGQDFILSPDQNLTDLRETILAAVRRGADFVEFDTVGRDNMFVLVTPSLPIRFEITERAEDPIEEWESSHSPFDHLGYDETVTAYTDA